MKKGVVTAAVLFLAAQAYAQGGAPQDPSQSVPGDAGAPIVKHARDLRRHPQADENAAEPAGEGVGGKCGTERWAVKTLSDANMNALAANPPVTNKTIHDLITVPAAPISRSTPDVRFMSGAYQETTEYQIRADVVGYKLEADHDYHVVIANPDDPSETMIAEFPDPACPGASSSGEVGKLAGARKAFDDLLRANHLPPPGGSLRKPKPLAVRITGVGFFDFKHGQDGVAPNARELHPVLSIEQM